MIGFGGAAGLLAVYITVLSLAESFNHAVGQLLDMWYWILLLITGFGIQAGLYSFIRRKLRTRPGGSTAELAASGGVSAGAMIACCAHHITDVLPLLGVSAAALFLTEYQVPFILLGIFSNIVGITMMLVMIQKHNLYPSRLLHNYLFSFNMRKIRGITVLSAVLVTGFSFFLVSRQADRAESVPERMIFNLETIVNDENFVTIEVKPLNLEFNEPVRFQVKMNTHQGDLGFDLAAISILEDDKGRILKPVSWEGSPPGGHHRAGVLTFPGVDEQSKWIKLTIREIYEVPKRIFIWNLI